MKTGSRGTFVISWTQTEIDGLQAPAMDVLRVGATWRWNGKAVRVDGPQDILVLQGAEEMALLRRRAAQMVRRLVGAAVAGEREAEDEAALPDDPGLPDQSFVLTDGRQSHVITLIPVPDTGARLLMAIGEMPPADRDLWVVRSAIDPAALAAQERPAGGVICFTPGTLIRTGEGLRPIEMLQQGDRVQTRDNGLQDILWTGSRRMTGARLHAMPHLRPERFRAGALGIGRPDQDLLVSPRHRMLVSGRSAQSLFNTDEVLIAAADLVNDSTVLVDHTLREVTYIHLLLERHNILFANGMPSESLHPASADLDTIDPVAREGLERLLPYVATNPDAYGPHARRNLSRSEAAILRHEIAA